MSWNIVQSDGGYRFWPDKVKGEGFFIACFRKTGGNDEEIYLPKIKPEKFSVKEMEILNKNVNTERPCFFKT